MAVFRMAFIAILCGNINNISSITDSAYLGKEFGLAFFSSFHESPDHALLNYVVIQSEEGGECTVEYKPSDNSQHKIVHHERIAVGGVIKIGLPETTQLNLQSEISHKGVSVSCTDDVLVFTLDRHYGDANVVHAVPTKSLSHGYYIPGVPNNAILGVVAMEDNTHVTVKLKTKCKYNYNNRDYGNSDVISVTLARMEVFALSTGHVDFFGDEGCDLGGTHVTANHNFVLYSGGSCTFFGDDRSSSADGCDKILLQVPPPVMWGKDFLVPDMAGDNKGYQMRVLASVGNTDVTLSVYNGGAPTTIHNRLGAGEFINHSAKDNSTVVVHSSQPVLVVQFLTYDPMTLLVRPIEHYPGITKFGSRYIFVTMEKTIGMQNYEDYENYITLITSSGHTKDVRLDGKQLTGVQWQNVPQLGYSIARLPVSYGSHMVDSVASSSPCAVQVYGYSREEGEAYGYTAVSTCSKQCTDLDLSSIVTDAQLTTGIADLINQVGTDATEKQCQGACVNSVSAIPAKACPKICSSFLFYTQKYYSH
ncbi:uncharacterized protein LOC124288013 [Haliotis rubra]|uniref:uncharacterized protein LOC124288013 n=1 Tax=Haliotis rubra TaxID=36100 RepID=UPI001EE5BF4D|nr:uncharacterized protein LOC124288013 [Haliotis rubra]